MTIDCCPNSKTDDLILSSSSSSSLVLSSSSTNTTNTTNSSADETTKTTLVNVANESNSNKYHIEEYEKRFLNSLKQLNSPEWLVLNQNTTLAQLPPTTKPRYDRIRQKTRASNSSNQHANSRSLSTPRNNNANAVDSNKIELYNAGDNGEDNNLKNSSSKSLMHLTASKNNYAHLARSRHYASMRNEHSNPSMKRSLSSYATPTNNNNSVCSSSSSINQGHQGHSSLLLASKSNTSLNSNRDASWYKPKQLQLPFKSEKDLDNNNSIVMSSITTVQTTTFESETVKRVIDEFKGWLFQEFFFFLIFDFDRLNNNEFYAKLSTL